MTELKTLRDFERREMPADRTTWSVPFVLSEELRAEAIKWVKEQEKCNKNKMGEKEIYLRTWIKTFFNLTEEDLK